MISRNRTGRKNMVVYLSEYIHPDAEALLRKRAEVVDSFEHAEILMRLSCGLQR